VIPRRPDPLRLVLETGVLTGDFASPEEPA
jgi:hypothetical protein